MNKFAFIFPGQGAQIAGMGKDFYENSATARFIYDKASELLNLDMRAMCFEENDLLDQTEYTQAALVTTCMAMERVLRERGINPDVTAGLSLGEYSAIASSGAMSIEDAIVTVRQRGIFMQNAVQSGEGAMAAVIGLPGEKIDQALEHVEGISVANYNCPGQLVITGWEKQMKTASDCLKEAGAKKIIPLNVSGPFHSPMMEEAGRKLESVLNDVELNEYEIPYVSNVTAEYVQKTELIKPLLVEQVAHSVKWQQSVEQMLKEGVDTFVEIGPGKTLAGFLRRIDRSVTCLNVGNWEDVDKVVELLNKN